MAENLFASFDISGQGMSLQRMRLSATAKNIANANTTKGPDGRPYSREIVIVKPIGKSTFAEKLSNAELRLSRSEKEHSEGASPMDEIQDNRVLEARSGKDTSPPRMVYDPSHPDADGEGYVAMPNINIVTEMVEMISAQRAFDANASVIQAAKNVARDSLEI